jgi:signal transduction histidine kinase
MPASRDAPGSVLPPLAAAEAEAALAPPWLPPAAAAAVDVARRAAGGRVPVLLRAPAAGGRVRLARALHALAGGGGPLVAVAGRRPRVDRLPAGASLYVDVGRLAPDAALALEAVVDDGAVWVLAGAEPGASLPVQLAPRLAAVVLEVSALARRPADLPALAAAVLDRLARRAGGTPPRLTSAALERLATHGWPGDVAELEAVLGGALLRASGGQIGPEHLGLDPAEAPPPTAPVEHRDAAGGEAALEFMLAELAHELRNPMVTIKTYAQHLPALLEDAELRERFRTLCDEAIGRMDGLLENVLAFARLGEPRPRPVAVEPLLDRVLGEVEPELAGRAVRVRRVAAPAAHCAGDPEQLAYALRNLLAGVAREVPAREELVLDAAANGIVTLRFAAGEEAAGRLRRLAAPDAAAGEAGRLGDPTLLPLAFRLARAVFERNGGALAVVPGANEATTLVVSLPTAGVDGT